MRRRAGLIAALLGLALTASACGIPIQSTASRLPSNLQLPSATTTTSQPTGASTSRVTVFFLKGSRLVPVAEYYPYDGANPNNALDAALFWLSIGPTSAQSDCGVTSTITQSTTLTLNGTPHNGIALVNVGIDFFALQGVALEETTAQIVYSLTGASSAVRGVQLTNAADRLESYIPPGIFVNRPVTRADYANLAPTTDTVCDSKASR